MEELIEQLKRIADATEAGNTLTQQWLDLNIQWRQENVEMSEQDYFLQRDWIEWQKHCHEAGVEQIVTERKKQDELMLALQRELLIGEKERKSE